MTNLLEDRCAARSAESAVKKNPVRKSQTKMNRLNSCIEMCAGAGGQALGLEDAGFDHQALVEIDPDCCTTLRRNRPQWPVMQADLKRFDSRPYRGIDLFAAGLPCPPFSNAGQRLGPADDRDLFPAALQLIGEVKPRAVMIENVAGLLAPRFADYWSSVKRDLRGMGYAVSWRLLDAFRFNVPQQRRRLVIVALRGNLQNQFTWPKPKIYYGLTAGEQLYDLISEEWPGARKWVHGALEIAPTIVGGSRKHGGPDLGPTGAKRAWAALGIDGAGIADFPPTRKFKGLPRLTIQMVARLQGFPDDWEFAGGKTSAYRQVGNAFPPGMASVVARQVRKALVEQS